MTTRTYVNNEFHGSLIKKGLEAKLELTSNHYPVVIHGPVTLKENSTTTLYAGVDVHVGSWYIITTSSAQDVEVTMENGYYYEDAHVDNPAGTVILDTTAASIGNVRNAVGDNQQGGVLINLNSTASGGITTIDELSTNLVNTAVIIPSNNITLYDKTGLYSALFQCTGNIIIALSDGEGGTCTLVLADVRGCVFNTNVGLDNGNVFDDGTNVGNITLTAGDKFLIGGKIVVNNGGIDCTINQNDTVVSAVIDDGDINEDDIVFASTITSISTGVNGGIDFANGKATSKIYAKNITDTYTNGTITIPATKTTHTIEITLEKGLYAIMAGKTTDTADLQISIDDVTLLDEDKTKVNIAYYYVNSASATMTLTAAGVATNVATYAYAKLA